MVLFEELTSLSLNELLYTVFLPFIVVFAIFFGALSAVRIFNKKINLVLSFALTLAGAYGGLFTWFAVYLLPLGAYMGVIAFAAVFFIGIIIWSVGRGKDIYYEAAPEKALEKVNKDIEKLYDKYYNESDPAKKRGIDRQIVELERRREHLSREMRR